MFHENSDDDVDENKLSHEDEDNKENWSNDRVDATVTNTIFRSLTVVFQGVLLLNK